MNLRKTNAELDRMKSELLKHKSPTMSSNATKPPLPFYSNKAAHEKIAELETDNKHLKSEIASLKSRMSTAKAVQDQLAAYERVRPSNSTTRPAASTAPATPKPGQVAFQPTSLAPMTREAFNAMSPSDRLAFVKQGGKIQN